jgi:hypothetical protein
MMPCSVASVIVASSRLGRALGDAMTANAVYILPLSQCHSTLAPGIIQPFLLSTSMVTGPSLWISTNMLAPNLPVCVRSSCCRIRSMNDS